MTPETGSRYPWIVRAGALVNQYYMYGLDLDFGPFLVKFSSYFPYGAKLCCNGHHWAQRQADAAGITFTTLDNGFLECDHRDGLQRICDRLSAANLATAACRRSSGTSATGSGQRMERGPQAVHLDQDRGQDPRIDRHDF